MDRLAIQTSTYHTTNYPNDHLFHCESLSAKALFVRLDELSALGLAFLYHACITFRLGFGAATADLLPLFPSLGAGLSLEIAACIVGPRGFLSERGASRFASKGS